MRLKHAGATLLGSKAFTACVLQADWHRLWEFLVEAVHRVLFGLRREVEGAWRFGRIGGFDKARLGVLIVQSQVLVRS